MGISEGRRRRVCTIDRYLVDRLDPLDFEERDHFEEDDEYEMSSETEISEISSWSMESSFVD